MSRTGDLYEVLQRGIYMRQTNGTYQGKEDKHRHTVFTLTAVLRESSGVGEEVVKQGQISFFDLAA